MRQYIVIVRFNGGFSTKRISAKNYSEARSIALDLGCKLTNYGQSGFLESVEVKAV